jgi:tryptophan halogenase
MVKSVCIVGGGTSGMIAALMIRKAYPKMIINVIESSSIGIVGVGEGSTEHWRFFIDYTDISVYELFRETDATFKIGIKFTNWHGDNSHYFHSLMIDFGGQDRHNGLFYTWLKMVGENWNPLDTLGKASQLSRHYEPLHDNINQYHFDTFKLNKFLHKKCSERNIQIIDTIIENVNLDENGFVDNVVDTKGEKFTADFFIDCSGFKRIIASKLGVKWVDVSNYLPMNSAIAFPTDYMNDIPSYTEATALSSGWSWRIPTQNRFGNGYVYCDKFIDDESAVKEITTHYKENLNIENINIGKKFKFSAGYVDNFWMKNCVSMGLSGMFVEPLEASSIGTTIQQCANFVTVLQFFDRDQNYTAKKYNKIMTDVATNIVDFIQLHYFTHRQDSDFWKFCKNSLEPTEFNREYLPYFKQCTPDPNFFRESLLLFKQLNFMQVMHGLRLLDSKQAIKIYETHLEKIYQSQIQKMKELDGELADSIPHRECTEILKSRQTIINYNL